MPSSPRSTSIPPVKRRRELLYRSRARKKHKRLDAIRDEPTASYLAHRKPADDDAAVPRRSSRVRRAPDLLDSSPVPSPRRKRLKDLDPPSGSDETKKGKWKRMEKENPVSQVPSFLGKEEDWKSRLRTRVGKDREKSLSSSRKSDGGFTEVRVLFPVVLEENIGVLNSVRTSRRRKKVATHEVSEAANEAGNDDDNLPLVDKYHTSGSPAEKSSQVDVVGVATDAQLGSEQARMLESAEKVVGLVEEAECVNTSVQDGGPLHAVVEEDTLILQSRGREEHVSDDHESNQSCKHPDSFDTAEREGDLKDNIQETEHNLKDIDQSVSVLDEKIASFRIKEGRRCGLCGCGSDGKPPKKLVHESFDSENEAYEGSTASEEPNYNVWDGFGDGPGWLGKLLGPLIDRFGIARVWVHQHCAVWSPEVYFAGLGCLKNVRAALCRGRALKCSRCGRPGATIGCRVDRCPKTYHLPCSRVEGCIFDHRKFLIACSDHRRFFQPHGSKHVLQIRKMKAKKLRLDLRKVSNEARRKDLEAEEKWLENCGEDEEFLKREGRRLHRDILRIAPIYIGGSSENENRYPGWESVAGLEHVIQCMKEVVLLPLLYPEFFGSVGLTPPRGVLLHGYPGTGKTHVVRALIGACSRGDKRIAYFARKGADCLGKYVGDAERQLRLLFQVAERSQPSIIFFDEIDGLAPRRSKQQDQTHSSVVSTLLSLLDGLKSRGSVIVIGATNRPDAVDPALRRPGRFDREIFFPLPTEKDRSSILSLHTRSWPKPLSGSLLSWIANQTVGYAGADIQALCAQAAMHALKRNCALQKILSSAAEGMIQGKLPCLPSFRVEERDWLAALTLAPPPCSRREAGIAVNDIVASPLPAHLISCLLLPLTHLIVSLYIDQQIWLSPMLFKASKFVKNVVVSALEQKSVPVTFWWSHLEYLIREPSIAEKIENKFAQFGLIIGSSGSNHPILLDEVDDESGENEKFDSFGMKAGGSNMQKMLMQKSPLGVGKSQGFRILISGPPRSGQQHLASCLLQGFTGHEDIRKNCKTMKPDCTTVAVKCLDVGRCILYLPRIDLWAIEDSADPSVSETQVNPEKSPSMTEKITVGRRGTSEMWNSFVEQVDSAVTAASLTILATCEVEKADLPLGLMRFFSRDVRGLANPTPTVCTIPRFFIHIDRKLDLERAINSAAEKLSYDLILHYLKIIHERTHLRYYAEDKHKVPHLDINSEAHKQSLNHALVIQEVKVQEASAGKTIISSNTLLEPEWIASNGGASCIKDQKFQQLNSTVLPQSREDGVVRSQPYGLQDSFPKTCKVLKGNLILAIATFGYQILRYPQFSELVWVTSKLKEGPCADVSGPWKRWPFNTCVMHSECSPDKRVSVTNPCNVNDMEPPGFVRGLIAVGLLAYRGFYASVSEVSADVRKVLELLVGRIREKLFIRKDRYRYFRVLSQVAYLDDMVNSWGYMLQSLQADNSITEWFWGDCKQMIQILGALTFLMISNNGEFSDTYKELGDYMLTKSDAGIILDVQNTFSYASLASKKLTYDGKSSGLESSSVGTGLNPVDQRPASAMTESIHIFKANNLCDHDSQTLLSKSSEKETSKRCSVVDTILPSNHTTCIPNEMGDATSSALQEKDNISKVSCLYSCCSNCVHMINVIARKMISMNLESNECCSVDDVHDIITSCSINILASFRKYFGYENSSNSEENFRRKLHCQAQLEDHNDGFKRMPCHCKPFRKEELLPVECDCHKKVEDNTILPNTGSGSLFESKLTYFFRDDVLVPLVPNDCSELHCNFEKICVCSAVMILLAIKQTIDL
ncbi:hypothetical protein IEQ34_020744 [Dendrobium chrysotoxum]|uniref:PHD-type domain-containing protein n=1 Tax=Dendrobium chrysotoxum TaxID=161865 RepID=A0AAV7G2W6_DENCH|nr:hypothetical protein IEQ34_020744 [Dendrobium chrysotoxum]